MINDIKTILFDAVGTLIYPARDVRETYADVGRKHGANATPSEIWECFQKVWASMMVDPFGAGGDGPQTEEKQKQWWRTFVNTTFAEAGCPDFPEAGFEELFYVFSLPESWQVFEDAAAVLPQLQSAKIGMAMVSNFDYRLQHICEGLGLTEYLQTVVISGVEGVSKPDRRIFDLALTAIEAEASSTAYVGDTYEVDITGAQGAELMPVLIDRQGNHENDSDCRVIKSLTELTDCLSKS